MAKPPKFSVNLCCYNSERYLEETLQSVFGQTFQDFELVVVNDGSRDATDTIIRRHLAAGRPIIYHPQANAGLGAARNKALELSHGELIALIDHDDMWEPRKLEKFVPLFDRPAVAFAGSDAYFINSAGRFLHRYSDVTSMRRGRVLRELFLCDFIPCASVVMRRAAIAAVGGLFRRDFGIAEEYELFLRLAEYDEFDYSPEALVRIRIHAASASWDIVREGEELRQLWADCLLRNPSLAASLGPQLLAVRTAGFSVSPALAEAFAGQGPFKLRLKAAVLTLLARFPSLADALRRFRRWSHRLSVARRESRA